MVFADLFFLYIFLPLFILLYGGVYLLEKKSGETKCRNAVLILFSILFYVWGEPVYILLLIGGVLIDYVCARTHKEILGIVLHLVLLAVFKYGNLLLSTIASAGVIPSLTVVSGEAGRLPAILTSAGERTVSIRLPIGISFYTFQSISYLADVRGKKCEPQKSFFRLLLYISMFPQLIAGPIVRYTAVAAEIDKRSTTEKDFAEGIRRFIMGLAKKVILADQLAVIVEQTMGSELNGLSTGMAWLGLIAFSLQIYYDFSGYSDMAIGMGRCMGFTFPENFDRPYLCNSVTDFWRRWHISLGSFFRDYVYIPLGGNRTGKAKWVFNILLVWALTGFWHGASWNFLIWGVYFGVLLLLEKLLVTRKGALYRIFSLFLIVLGWGIFYFDDFGKMRSFFGILFGLSSSAAAGGFLLKTLLSQNAFLLAAAILLCGLPTTGKDHATEKDPAGNGRENGRSSEGAGTPVWILRTIFSVALLVVSVLLLIGASTHPFLYTRF